MNNRKIKYSGCGGSDHLLPLMSSRRDFLQVGLIGGLGLTLPEFFRMEANAAQKFYESKEGRAKSIVHVFIPRCIAQHESFNPKPYLTTKCIRLFNSL